jgi:uncharacterized protein (UPF0548 family)
VQSIFTLRRASAWQSRLALATHSALTYPHLGSTLIDVTPRGFHGVRDERVLGTGPAVFAKAREGLQQWRAHRGTGLLLIPRDASVHVGENVVVVIPLGPLAIAAPCRVIAVIDEPRRFAYAYGTLRGHPESGEELFDLTLRDNDEVLFSIRAFSKAASVLTRIGSPVARTVQAKVTTRYLNALEHFVTTP